MCVLYQGKQSILDEVSALNEFKRLKKSVS